MKRKQLNDRLRALEDKAASNEMQKLLDASMHIDTLSDLERAKGMLRELRPALEDLKGFDREIEFKTPEAESDGEVWMTAEGIAMIDSLISSGDLIFDEEQAERGRTDRRLRLEANTSSKLLKKMLDATSDVDGVPDVEAAKRLLYGLRQDLEKMATVYPRVSFKPAPTDPTLTGIKESKCGLGMIDWLYLHGDIVFLTETDQFGTAHAQQHSLGRHGHE
jgi:hypothetical protein